MASNAGAMIHQPQPGCAAVRRQMDYNGGMELIDSHCHLDVADFDVDREAVLAECHARGVNRIVVPGIMAASWDNLLKICRHHEGLYPALGLHPIYIDDHRQQDLATLERYLADEVDLVAVGEIGLDFYILIVVMALGIIGAVAPSSSLRACRT